MIVSREEGFTLLELMIVIMIIAILVAIAVPVYMSLQNKASRSVAQANRRIASAAMDSVYINDILGKGGGPGYVDPSTGDPIDAAWLAARESKIKWVDMTLNLVVDPNTGEIDPDSWPEFSTFSEAQKTGVVVVRITGSPVTQITIATLSKDGHCWFDSYDKGEDGEDDSGDFNWADGPPG